MAKELGRKNFKTKKLKMNIKSTMTKEFGRKNFKTKKTIKF